jgi:hypothetical protein
VSGSGRVVAAPSGVIPIGGADIDKVIDNKTVERGGAPNALEAFEERRPGPVQAFRRDDALDGRAPQAKQAYLFRRGG